MQDKWRVDNWGRNTLPKSPNYKGTVWIDGMQERANDWVQVMPETIGQYTGLLDNNGKKIFEGDILRTSNKNEPIWYVDYKLCGFCVNQRNVNYSCRLDEFEIETDLEVIGNVHDNPELLDKIDEE